MAITKYNQQTLDKSNTARNSQINVTLIKGDDNSLEKWINSSDFLDTFKVVFNGEVTEQIYSYRMFPFAIDTFLSDYSQLSATSYLKCGQTQKEFPNHTFYDVSRSDGIATRKVASVTITPYFYDFRDYQPYTRMWLYLPFLGVRELDVNRLSNGTETLDVYYTLNIIDGRALIRVVDSIGENIFIQEECDISIDIPLTRSDITERMKNVTLMGANLGLSALSGGTLAPLIASNSIMNLRALQPHYELGALDNGMLKMYMPNSVHLIIQRPKNIQTQEQREEYIKENGLPCENYYSFNELQDSSDDVYCKFNVQTKDFKHIAKLLDITNDELNEFVAKLNQGVYIPYLEE